MKSVQNLFCYFLNPTIYFLQNLCCSFLSPFTYFLLFNSLFFFLHPLPTLLIYVQQFSSYFHLLNSNEESFLILFSTYSKQLHMYFKVSSSISNASVLYAMFKATHSPSVVPHRFLLTLGKSHRVVCSVPRGTWIWTAVVTTAFRHYIMLSNSGYRRNRDQ